MEGTRNTIGENAGDGEGFNRQGSTCLTAGDFDVRVIGDDVTRDRGRIFQAGGRIVDGRRRVIDRGDGDRQGVRGRSIRRTVVLNGVSKDRDSAVPVSDGRIRECTIGLQGQRADVIGGSRFAEGVSSVSEGKVGGLDRIARWDGDETTAVDLDGRDRHRVAFRIAVIQQQVTRRRAVFGRSPGVGNRIRGIVDRREREREGAVVGEGGVRTHGDLVRDDVGRVDGTVPVGKRREGVRTISLDGERPLEGDIDRSRG